MKSQENDSKFIINYSRFLYRLAKHENPNFLSKTEVKKLGNFIHCELDSLWGNGCPYVSRVSDKEIAKMFVYCKQHPKVKFLVFDYRDRFACTKAEYQKREKLFKRLGVNVVYKEEQMPDYQATMNELMNILEQEDYDTKHLAKKVEEAERYV